MIEMIKPAVTSTNIIIKSKKNSVVPALGKIKKAVREAIKSNTLRT